LPVISESFGVPTAGDPGAPKPPSFIALLSLKLGPFFAPAVGTAGADLGNPGAIGLLIAPGNLKFPAILPERPPVGEKPVFGPDEPAIGGAPMRCCCRARALCSKSGGKLLTLAGGRLALFKMAATLELGLMVLFCCGSETVRSDGTLRGSSSGLVLGGSRGVLASEESSTESGEAGLLAENSSGVSGDELRRSSAMVKRTLGVVFDVRLYLDQDMCCQELREGSRLCWLMTLTQELGC